MTDKNLTGANLDAIFGSVDLNLKGAIIKKDQIISKLEVDMLENEKKLFVNQTEIKKVADYISNLNVIVISLNDSSTTYKV